MPGCVDEAKRRHNCSNRVIRDYEAAMARYDAAFTAHFEAVNAYFEALNKHVRLMNDFIQCERTRIVPEGSIIRG